MSEQQFGKRGQVEVLSAVDATVPGPGIVAVLAAHAIKLAALGMLGSLIGVLWAASGRTLTAADYCRERTINTGYARDEVPWDAPAAVREAIQTANYSRRMAYEAELSLCLQVTGTPYVTCGPLKCGGLFSTETEGTQQRQVREQAARDLEQAGLAAVRRHRDRQRVERVLEVDRRNQFEGPTRMPPPRVPRHDQN